MVFAASLGEGRTELEIEAVALQAAAGRGSRASAWAYGVVGRDIFSRRGSHRPRSVQLADHTFEFDYITRSRIMAVLLGLKPYSGPF
jgi:hypothetical protein